MSDFIFSSCILLVTEKELVDRMKMLEQEKKEILQKVAEVRQRVSCRDFSLTKIQNFEFNVN